MKWHMDGHCLVFALNDLRSHMNSKMRDKRNEWGFKCKLCGLSRVKKLTGDVTRALEKAPHSMVS